MVGQALNRAEALSITQISIIGEIGDYVKTGIYALRKRAARRSSEVFREVERMIRVVVH